MSEIMHVFRNFSNRPVIRFVRSHLPVATMPASPAPQNAKKSIKAPFCHKTMWAFEAAPHFPPAKTPYNASFTVPEGAGCWSRRSTLVVLAAPIPQKLSTAQRSYPQKSMKTMLFHDFGG
jgi:hypothetical protein